MGIGAALRMYDVVVKTFTFAVSSPDEFLFDFSKWRPPSILDFQNFEIKCRKAPEG